MSDLTVSMVRRASDTRTRDVALHEALSAIRTGGRSLLGQITQIRSRFQAELAKNGGDLKAAKRAIEPLKKALPAIMPCGQFRNREQPVANKLRKHSGLFIADFDDLGDKLPLIRKKLEKSAHVFAFFLSPSGNGLKAFFRVPADESAHAGSFRAVEKHVRELTGCEIDKSGKDVARLCFMSYDPELYVNPNAIEITPLPEPEKPKATLRSDVNLSERQRIATGLLGNIDWQSETSGYVVCPGKHLHTAGDGERDCKIDLDGVPTLHCFHDHCRGILDGINHELRSGIGKAEHVKPGEAPQWQEPQSLPEDLPAVPPFNFDCLPGTLRPWIQDISDRMQCPPDFPAIGAMIALGSLVGRKIGVRPKRYDDWLVIPNLWGCVVGRPGLMKTPALEQPMLPLRRLVVEAFDAYEVAMRNHKVNAMLSAQQKKLVEGKIGKHLKAGDEQAARDEAVAHLGKDDDKPACRRYEVNDSTVEKLGELLAENPNGLLLFRDELSGFLRLLDREDRAGDRAKYLEMWAGTGELTYDRIERGTVRIPSNTLSILGGIQPDLLIAYVREAVRGGTGNDGLLQRFQLFVWPDAPKEWRNVDRWPDTEAKNEAFSVFKYLDGLRPEAIDADTSNGIPFLRFANEAQERFDTWRAELEKKLRSDTEHPAFEAHLAKYRKLVPALALLIHLADRKTGPVSLYALKKALLWATYLEDHAERIYSSVLRPDTAAARELAKHLQREDLPERFKLREIYRKGWVGLNAKEDAEAATEILCDLGWIRPAVDAPGRAASPAFDINPKIFKHPPRPTDKTDQTDSVSSVSNLPGVLQKSEPAKTTAEQVPAAAQSASPLVL